MHYDLIARNDLANHKNALAAVKSELAQHSYIIDEENTLNKQEEVSEEHIREFRETIIIASTIKYPLLKAFAKIITRAGFEPSFNITYPDLPPEEPNA